MGQVSWDESWKRWRPKGKEEGTERKDSPHRGRKTRGSVQSLEGGGSLKALEEVDIGIRMRCQALEGYF